MRASSSSLVRNRSVEGDISRGDQEISSNRAWHARTVNLYRGPLGLSAGSIPQSANALDLDGHRLIRQQPSLRISAETNSRRRSGTDDISCFQRNDTGDICNEVWDFEDQIARICRLHNLIIQG